MHVRWIRASVFVALSSLASAQSAGVLGKNDAAFAQLLKAAGYTDLAEKLVGAIERSGKVSGDEAVGVKALHIDLSLEVAAREPDPIKRKDALKKILSDKEEFIASYAGRREAEEASNTLPDVYRMLGESITVAIQREKDLEKVKLLQKEGAEIYQQAEDKLKARLEKLDAADRSSQAVEDQYIAVRYNLPRTYYYHALLYPKEEFRRKDLLNQAIKGFQEFGLDFGELLFNYEALILEGLCHKELDEFDDAKAAFRDAFKFPESLGIEKDGKGYYQLSKEAADVVSSAALQMMLLLSELKDHAGAIEVAKQFVDSTPGAYEVRSGLAVVAARAEAHLALGDAKGAGECAEKLVEEDPRGPWGARGRELQSRTLGSGPVDVDSALKIAQTLMDRGETDRAIQVARQAMASAKGHPKEPQVVTEAFMLIANVYKKRGWMNEAALCYDAAAERFPSAERAPECLSKAITCYIAIDKEEKKAYYKKKIEERQKTLSTRYPNSEFAGSAQLVEAQQLLAEGKYLEAAEQYAKVPPGAANYLDAQYGAGDAYFQHARDLLKDPKTRDKKVNEAKPYVGQAETLLKKIMADVEVAIGKTIALDVKGRLDVLGLRARVSLAQLYLLAGVDRPADVVTLLEGADERYASNADALTNFWTLRIRAFIQLGKLDEAIAKLDALAKKDPKSKAIAGAARVVATALDERAKKLADEKKPKEAAEELKRAAKYYAMAGSALLDSDSPKVSEVETLATRLYTIGLDMNEVPTDRETFIGWDAKAAKDTSLWPLAADLLERGLKLSPNYKSEITLARIFGFLGKWDKCATKYGALFDAEPLYDFTEKKFTPVAATKRDLLLAWFEFAVAEREVGLIDNDTDRFRRAADVFDVLVKPGSFPATSCYWWWAKYFQVRVKCDSGLYDNAGLLLKDTLRSSSDVGGSCGLWDRFSALRDELVGKGVEIPAMPPKPAPNPAAPAK